MGVGSCGTAAFTGKQVIVEDIATHPYWAPYKELAFQAGLGSCWSQPILSATDKVLGTFAIYHHKVHTPTESNIDLIEGTAHLISLSIERKQAEHMVQKERRRFRDFSKSSADWFWEMDAHLRFTYFSENFESHYGLKQEDALGKTRPELLAKISPYIVPTIDDHVEQLNAHLPFRNFEYPILTSSQDLRWMLVSGVPVFNMEGHFEGYRGVGQDITQRKQAEMDLRNVASKLEQANAQIKAERATLTERVAKRTAQLEYANKAKDSFLATMSHEIRTPLGGMLGMMELLNLSSLNAEQRHQLETAQLSGKSLLRIVNDILDWSKIEAGKLELSPHIAAIEVLLNSVASTYAQLAADKGITLSLSIDPHLSREHIFDPLRLSQILNNFTSNAVKFTQQGSVEISAQRLECLNSHETVRFSVKDSGEGINEEQQSRLFQHYEQATADTARMYGGTGLGLAICRRLGELMDGTLSVESTIDVGSTFYFTISLPVAGVTPVVEGGVSATATDTETTAQQQLGMEGSLTVNGRPLSVLIVDDHPVNRMLLKQQLGMLGVQVVAAESGSPALKLWQSSHFDIIITDCHMPEMDGYELTRKIREIEQPAGGSFHIPIIAWTANVLSDEVERCNAAGMDDFLTKPTELADLKAMLVKWMQKDLNIALQNAITL
jgi:PAS domain S-box-containing protein